MTSSALELQETHPGLVLGKWEKNVLHSPGPRNGCVPKRGAVLGFRAQTCCVQVPALPFTSFGTLGR